MIRRFRILLLATAVLLACVFSNSPGFAQEIETLPMGGNGGKKLAATLRNLRADEDHEWRGQLKLIGRDRKVAALIPVVGRAINGTNQWKVVYETAAHDASGAESLTVIHTEGGPNKYLYARAKGPDAPLGEAKVLRGAGADIQLAGSDFWLSDLGFEFFHWPEQEILRAETRHSRACYVLQSTNPNPNSTNYAKVLTWIDRETGAPIQAHALDANDRKIKEFAIGDVMKVNGQWELKDMEISNRKTRSTTKLEFDLEGKRAAGVPNTVLPPQ